MVLCGLGCGLSGSVELRAGGVVAYQLLRWEHDLTLTCLDRSRMFGELNPSIDQACEDKSKPFLQLRCVRSDYMSCTLQRDSVSGNPIVE